MAIVGNNLKLFFFSVLGHHWDSLEREMYTKQALLRIRKGIIGNN